MKSNVDIAMPREYKYFQNGYFAERFVINMCMTISKLYYFDRS